MNYDYRQTEFSKAVLSGLFAGIIATLINLAYDYFYRDMTGFQLSTIINVPSIILASTLLLTIAGLIFYVFKHFIRKGSLIYRVVFLAITIFCVYLSLHAHRSANPVLAYEFKWLLFGVVVVLGGLAAFFIPYLFDHEEIYS